jgi:hypothetical protein
VLHGNRLYVRDDAGETPAILNASTGKQIRTFDSWTAPAFSGNTGFYLPPGGPLEAVSATTGAVKWTAAGDGQLDTAPIVVGDDVAVGSATGEIFLFDQATGGVVWSAQTGSPILAPDEHNAWMLVGLAESGGTLLVPATNTLVAYTARAATTTAFSVSPTSGPTGTPATVSVTVSPTGGGPTPTGTVQLVDNGSALGAPLTLDGSGQATEVTKLPGGVNSVVAVYSGDPANAPSTSAAVKATYGTPTALKASLAIVAPSNGGWSLSGLAGTLTTKDGTRLAGKTLTFFVAGELICTAVTDSNGFASCSGSSTSAAVGASTKYQVGFLGTATYLPSSTSGGLGPPP